MKIDDLFGFYLIFLEKKFEGYFCWRKNSKKKFEGKFFLEKKFEGKLFLEKKFEGNYFWRKDSKEIIFGEKI